MDLFDYADTYSDDLELFESLGLKPFKRLKNWNKTLLGEVDNVDYTVKVWVETAPAQFWSFEIFNKDAQKITYKLSTGSGTLSQYWPIVIMFATGMLVSERVNEVEI